MKINSIQKSTMTLLRIALGMQAVYCLHTVVITFFPRCFLVILGLKNYDFPVIPFYLMEAAIVTAGFAGICLTLLRRIRNCRKVGVGFDVLMGIFIFAAYLVIPEITGIVYNFASSKLIDMQTLDPGRASTAATVGENAAGVSYIATYCTKARGWFFIAILLLTAAYAVYRFFCKDQILLSVEESAGKASGF